MTRPFHPPVRRASLRRQLVLPMVGLLLAAVLGNVAFTAWLAARRSAQTARAGQEQVAAALRSSRVSLSLPVLEALAQLTGSQFVVWDPAAGTRGLATLPREAISDGRLAAALPDGTVDVGGQRHRLGVIRSGGVRPETVIVLTPVRTILAATLETVWPVLAVAAATLAALVPLGWRLTGRLAARIGAIERHVGRIAEGDLGHRLHEERHAGGDPDDEIGRLMTGVNRMTATLGELRTSLVAGERQRLLGQLAAGFAHELRNAITGARLAIDLHRRRCTSAAPGGAGAEDGSLAVAVRQLDIVEEEVRGLLALGRAPETAPTPVSVDGLLGEVRDLTGPRCEHAGVRMECELPTGITLTGRHDTLRAALVNLALNGVDAAGRGGTVRLVGETRGERVVLAVEDTGQGPPVTIRDTIREPFVTGKPEGIGLGLAVAKAVAEEHGGGLEWERLHGRTRFEISLPSRTLPTAAAPREPSA